VLLARQLESGGRTLGLALAELAGYVVLALVATAWLERELLTEALDQVIGRPVATTSA
jgi:hypothetical protein